MPKSKGSDGPLCSSCGQYFDYKSAGVGITEANYNKLSADRKAAWKCGSCRNTSPIVVPTASSSSPLAAAAPTDMRSVLSAIKNLSDKLKPIDQLVADMRVVKSDLSDLKTSVEAAHAWMRELSEKMKTYEKRLVEVEEITSEVSAEVCVLRSSLKRVEATLNDKEQWSRLSNVEIKGMPFSKNENLYEIILNIAKKCDTSIKKEDISFVSRVPTRKKDEVKPIIACFHNRYIKEDLVSAARGFKGILASDLGYQESSKIFVNDHLTAANKQLLSKAKNLAKEYHFQFIWVKNCKILLRKNATSPILTMRTEEDLKKIT